MLKEIRFGQEEILYITDQEETYAALRKEGRYVLPYYHEGNRGAVFPGAIYAVECLEEVEEASLEMAYRRLAGLPWEILQTERCVIRETTVEDVDSFYRLYEETSITEYMEPLFEDRDEEIAYTKNYIEKVYGFYGYGMWTVLEKNSGEVIGRAGITWREGYELPELGFVIGVPWQRQGYAFEVCAAILAYAKTELLMEQVQALVQPGNTNSLRLCEKLGFTLAGETILDGEKHLLLTKSLQRE
ncbi:MAG: GNAT family N-acetyltransferase [Lachnospiraceae bacterium]|nr:GNAT family N-acetyltransferase [Lachnospiraceae bacterium]